jgi:uncharacterized protein (TIGR00375 family)
MRFFADFNIHSKYARGTHPDMEIPTIAKWAKYKGVGLVGTGDFTHPQWLVALKKFMKPAGRGVYEFDGVRFLLTAELVCSYVQDGKPRKINHLILAPHFSAADRVIDVLEHEGNLETEARPTVKLSAEALAAAVRKASPEAMVIPAHAWGPQHSLFSATFGFDSLEAAYGAESAFIKAVETGHSADPAMARRWSSLDGRALISNSDAHHPAHLGREANLFDCAMDYREITEAVAANDRSRFLATLEMIPEEDRHFAAGCKACRRPAARGETACASCGKPVAPGVSDRVAALADRTEDEGRARAERHHRLLPLIELIADVRGLQPDADTVEKDYMRVVSQVGPELEILLHWEETELRGKLPARLADAVLALRRGDVTVGAPGYDGQPGRARVNLPPAPAELAQQKLF